MQKEDKILFNRLRKEVAAALMKSYPGISPDASEWKGQDILDFQEDLIARVNGQVSEKWFYTHMKAQNASLPRIDVLNMLSLYAGYSNWNDFRYKNKTLAGNTTLRNPLNKQYKIIILFIALVIILIALTKIFNTQNYRIAFIDNDTNDTLRNEKIRAVILNTRESPVTVDADSSGIINVPVRNGIIRMVVKAPYYIEDTITRIVRKSQPYEQVRLKPDYYALMVDYFSRTDVGSWQKRRESLDKIFSDDAIIFQMPDVNELSGLELYTRDEFIDKLTMPSSALKRIEVIDCRYKDNKVTLLRFRYITD